MLEPEHNVADRVFCGACNTPRTKNILVEEEHCKSLHHKKKEELLCFLCHRPLPRKWNVVRKQHKMKLKANQHLCDDSRSEPGFQTQKIASELKSMLTATHCFVCQRSTSINDHYKTKKHIVKVLSWIKLNAARFCFDMKNIASLYCEVCNDLFESVGASLFHYISEKHRENKENYCATCKKHVLDMNKHRATNSHINTSKCKELPINDSKISVEIGLDLAHISKFPTEVADRKSEIVDSNNTKYEDSQQPLKDKVIVELTEVVNKLCFSKLVSYGNALAHLRDLNRNIPADTSTDDSDILSAPETVGASNISIPNFDSRCESNIENPPENYSKRKLAMEIRRVKLVLTNLNRISVETALQYVSNLNQLVQDLINGGTKCRDIIGVFEIEPCQSANGREEALHEELEKLEDSLTDGNKIEVETALDCITQFNIHLETLLFTQH